MKPAETPIRGALAARLLARWLVPGVLLALVAQARAELQFDVFLGFDDRVREGHWFPAAFEIQNSGPTFVGTVVLAPEGGLDSQPRSFSIELPTGTRKRAVIPVFSSSGRYARWEARLLDPSGKTIGERSSLQPRDIAFQTPILGALPRSFGGLPSFPEPKNRSPDYVPAVARLQADYLPSNPIALEGLTAFYLNSEKAADLKPESVEALLAWLYQGGHLVVAIEQPGDVNAVPWLRGVLPLAPESVTTRNLEGSFERWLVSGKRVLQLPSVLRRASGTGRNPMRQGRVTVQTPATADTADPFATIQPQNEFNNTLMGIVLGKPLDGETILGLGEVPLIRSASRGRGTITVLAFSPEREPFHGWKNKPWFWAKLVGVPPELLAENDRIRDTTSIDGIFGAMLDSRQVRKLPVAALLLLLVVYLAVIGPLDQWILKRIGRQMWTWVTFPLYVVIFSGLIYFIGYRLRAGELEWNEMQVVDQLPRAEGAALRGRTWASLYSPANARYRFVSDQAFATFRAEFQHGGTGRAESGRLGLRHPPRGFEADAVVPVWVNQLYASDWLDAGPALIEARLESGAGGYRIHIRNNSALHLEEVKVAYGKRLHDLGNLAAGSQLDRELRPDGGRDLDEVAGELSTTLSVVQQRRFAFGSEGSGQLTRDLTNVILASLVDHAASSPAGGESIFAGPSGFDVSRQVRKGEAVVFAWAPGQSVAAPIHRFNAGRIHRDTVLRVCVPGPGTIPK